MRSKKLGSKIVSVWVCTKLGYLRKSLKIGCQAKNVLTADYSNEKRNAKMLHKYVYRKEKNLT